MYCLTIDPAFFPMMTSDMKPHMGGSLWRKEDGYKKIRVPTNNANLFNSFTNAEAIKDVDKIVAAIQKYLPYATALKPLRVLGHSRGAQLIFKLIRDRWATLGINPALIEFYCSGCPEAPITGACTLYPAVHVATYPGTGGYGVGYGLPPTTTARVWVIIKQYDGWCDARTSLGNTLADNNDEEGRSKIHMNYGADVNMQNPNRREYTHPGYPGNNVKLVYFPTYPIAIKIFMKFIPQIVRNADKRDRPIIESAHTGRPVTMLNPNYLDPIGWV